MRQLKFRAFDEGQKVMHNDFQYMSSGDDGNDWIVFKSDKQGFEEGVRNPYFRQQLHIMQFTGLHDKNGKEIYEGDVIKGGVHQAYEVSWSDELTGWNIGGAIVHQFEIIGNIYEHPHLLTSPRGQMEKE